VTRAYRKALTAARRNLFFLQSSTGQLEMLQSLGMRNEFVKAGLLTMREEMRRLRQEEESENGETPKTAVQEAEGYVFLFTGYMVSNAFKMEDQFPPGKEKDIKAAIRNMLGKYKAGPNDLAIVTGMDAGSEILCGMLCRARVPVKSICHTWRPT
jgi:hypothetical protein